MLDRWLISKARETSDGMTSAIATKKPHWIDFDAGRLLDDPSAMDERTDALFEYVLDVASGRLQTNNERNGIREIAIWKEGVTL